MPYISRAMYSRFLIPLLKPNLKKIIYTDIDVIFVDDILKLYEMELNNYTIAAVTSYRIKENKNSYIKTIERLGLSNEQAIFISGLLLVDCEKWNQDDTTQKLLELTLKLTQQNKLVFPDQDVLNKFFDNNYLHLDKKWGLIHKALKLNFKEDEIKNIIANQSVIHYTGGGHFKPWNNKKIEGAEYFWKYVKYTAFKKDINKIYKKFNSKLSFIEKIFSVKNQCINEKKYKIITILGFKFKLRRKIT